MGKFIKYKCFRPVQTHSNVRLGDRLRIVLKFAKNLLKKTYPIAVKLDPEIY